MIDHCAITITSDYDGTKKFETIIGNGTFIASNTTLIALVYAFLSMLHTVTRLSISMDKSSHYDTTTNLSVSDIDANRLASVFKLLGDTNRLKLVLACLNEPQAVCCLATKAGMSQPLTSHHLAALKKARILKSERIGKRMLYALDDHHIRHVICDLAAHLQE